MKIMKLFALTAVVAAASVLGACANDDYYEMKYPPKYVLPELPDDLPVVEDVQKGQKAPLYWSVYEYCYTQSIGGVADADMDISSDEWDKIIDWVATDLKPAGYNMICTDGFIPMLAKDESGYMTHYGSVSLKDLVAKCKAKGLELGVYDNPLWIHGDKSTKIEGTDYTFGDLTYDGVSEVRHPGAEDKWFTWAVSYNPGFEEYIDGFFKHYSDLGIKFIRMDFLSWYEDGNDRGMGTVGLGYGRIAYAKAMGVIAQKAKKYGIFTSLVMPHMYNGAEVEARYGNMTRIVADTGNGGWAHCSSNDKGKSYDTWPNCNNQFDGFVYWSHITGRDKIIADGDFIRLNTFSSDYEKQTVISLQLMAGGPIAASDQYSTIGDNLSYYTNSEMLALNADGFVGKPLRDKLGEEKNEIWYGQMTNGDYVIGIFNRSDNSAVKSVSFKDLGIEGEWKLRDLWTHTDEGTASSLSNISIPAHGCKIVKLSK